MDKNEQNIRTAEEKAANTDDATEKQAANDKAEGLKTAGTEIKLRIQKLRENLDKLNVVKKADKKVPPPSKVSSSISFKLPQLVDEQTKAKLKLIPLDADQRRDALKFTEVYERKMVPAQESRTFKSKLADLRQKSEESIEEFSYRIFSIASRAYSDDEKIIREEASDNTFKRGISDPYIKRKLNEDSLLNSFERATEVASRLETIDRALKPKHDSTEKEEVSEELVHAIRGHDCEQKRNLHAERPRNSYRGRNKYQDSRSRDSRTPQAKWDGAPTAGRL